MATPEFAGTTQRQFGRLIDPAHKRAAYDVYLALLVHDREKESLPHPSAPLRKRVRALLESQPALQYDALPLMRRLVFLGAVAGTAGFIAFNAAATTGLSVATVTYAAVTVWFVTRVRDAYVTYRREREAAAKASTEVLDKADRVWGSQEVYDDTVKSTRGLLAPVLGPKFDIGALINEVAGLPIQQVLHGASALRRAEARRVGIGAAETEAPQQPSQGDGPGSTPAAGNTAGASEAKAAARQENRPWLSRSDGITPSPEARVPSPVDTGRHVRRSAAAADRSRSSR